MTKQDRVYRAVACGALTRVEVSAVTGLSERLCSAHLSNLKNAGRIEIVKRHARRYSCHGWACHEYAVVVAKPAGVAPAEKF